MKRERIFINLNGDQVKPFTNEVIKKNEPEYKPTKEEIERVINLPKEPIKLPEEIKPQATETTESPIAAMIKKQVQEAVLASIKELDIKAIVNEALKDALK